MAVNTRNSIVTNGLVLTLDAGNTKSYTSGSTTWGNLVNPLLSGSLVNGPTFNSNNGGSIRFDGANDYVQFDTLPQGFQAGMTNYSISIWFKLYNTNKEAPLLEIGTSNADYSRIMFWFTGTTPNRLYALGASTNSAYRYSSVNINLETIYNAVYTYNNTGTRSQLFINGIEDTGLTNSTTNGVPTSLGSSLTIGCDSVYGHVYTQFANIYSVNCYNRTLSAAEVLQNYNAGKTRFGLS